MKTTIHLQPAYILHLRPYRETSAWLELFTLEKGRISVLARGIRRGKTPLKGLLQPFVPVLVSFMGNSDNWLLTHAEGRDMRFFLKGNALLSGFYVNELLLRLLGTESAYPVIFSAYENLLQKLQQETFFSRALRVFEKNMLDALGYGLRLTEEVQTGIAVLPDAQYAYHLEEGPVLIQEKSIYKTQLVLRGKTLWDLANETLEDPVSEKEAKYLLRAALSFHMNGRPLKTREFFNMIAQLTTS